MLVIQDHPDCPPQAPCRPAHESSRQAVAGAPRRDVSGYLEDAADRVSTIVGIIDPPVHASVVSGHPAPDQRTGARMGDPEAAAPWSARRPLMEGERVSPGDVSVDLLGGCRAQGPAARRQAA